MTNQKRIEKVEALQAMLLGCATGGTRDSDAESEYRAARTELMADATTAPMLPSFVRTHRTLQQFWPFIQSKGGYAERRAFLFGEFGPVLNQLEASSNSPVDGATKEVISTVDSAHVREAWDKMLQSKNSDPEGAITKARSLIESVCKFILDECGEAYSTSDDLPKLYRAAAKQLNLAPDQHAEEAFKQILGGCTSAVNGLAEMRNKLGDAHGKGAGAVKPSPRHAELAVNLAGTMTSFLVRTWEERKAATNHNAKSHEAQ